MHKFPSGPVNIQETQKAVDLMKKDLRKLDTNGDGKIGIAQWKPEIWGGISSFAPRDRGEFVGDVAYTLERKIQAIWFGKYQSPMPLTLLDAALDEGIRQLKQIDTSGVYDAPNERRVHNSDGIVQPGEIPCGGLPSFARVAVAILLGK